MNYSLTCVRQSRCDTHLLFLLLNNLSEFPNLCLLTYDQVCYPRSNPKRMLNFLKGPEGRQLPSDLDGSGPLSEWPITMTDQEYNPGIINMKLKLFPGAFL